MLWSAAFALLFLWSLVVLGARRPRRAVVNLSGLVASGALILAPVARGADVAFTFEPGVVLPLTAPQSDVYGVGAGQEIKALFALNRYLDIGPAVSVLMLSPNAPRTETGVAWGFGAGLRLKRPHDAQSAYGVSPWLDADALYVRTGPLNRPGFDVGAGLAVPLGESRIFWLGPFVRYQHVIQMDRVGYDNHDAKLLTLGASLEVGTGIERPHEELVAAPAEVRTVTRDVISCPDRDHDGIPDAVDPCPDVAGLVENGGCPKYEKVVVKPDRLELKEKVYFAWDQARIETDSYPLLDEVVQALKDHRGGKVQVDGHTDSSGENGYNQGLSERRAQAVVDYLVAHGIPARPTHLEGLCLVRAARHQRHRRGSREQPSRRVPRPVRHPHRWEHHAMNHFKTAALVLSLAALAACGNQIVEFELDAGGEVADAGGAIADAGPLPDGGQVDAGQPDSGVPDSGQPDAGLPDAGQPDAGLPDAGQPDAGLPDAGLVPAVFSTTPLNLATNVASAIKPTATFTMAMTPSTITGLSFTLAQGATPVTGAVTLDVAATTATFTPTAALGANLLYTATITTAAKSAGGRPLAANYVWTFNTALGASPPTVLSTTPLNLASAVPLNVQPTATFSKAMDPTTLTALTFTLAQGATPIAGAVALDVPGTTATFTPTLPLTNGLLYTATLTTGAKDTGGLALALPYTWTFTTAAAPPTVILTTPANLAINVAITNMPTATFSTAMDPTTITSLTFTLKQGLVTVPGVVTWDTATKTAKFTPSALLGLNLPYTATITTGARNLAGTALATDYVWTFTTAACSQGPIALLTAANFAVLGGSTVTSTGPSSVTGDVGISPGTALTGFPPGSIVGTQHLGDPTSAQGIADLTTAYNEAAGRVLCPVTVAGNLGGQTLAPGLYKSTSSLAISSGDLTLDAQGDGSAVFIFQMASTLTTTAGRQVILTNGAKSANVFWQVGTSATLGTTSAFQGTIMADQAVTLNTGATLNGRALARIAAVNLDSNVIVLPTP